MAKRTGEILKRIRCLMKKLNATVPEIHAYIIPSGDMHQSEYIAPCHQRRQFVSGFTGSAGTAIVTIDKALMWTDGRYYLQAKHELDENWTLMKEGLQDTPTREEWLSKELPNGSRVGVDPYLISLDEWRRISKKLEPAGCSLVRVDKNLVDIVWSEYGKPNPPKSTLMPWDIGFSGKAWLDKVGEVRTCLRGKGAHAVVIASLDEIAWLFNLRGADIEYNPVFCAYTVVTMDSIELFLDTSRVTDEIREHLLLNCSKDKPLIIHPYESIEECIKKLSSDNYKIWISSRNSAALSSLVPVANLISDVSPVCVLKAIKNPTEIEGMKRAHVRDAAALCQYLAWLEKEIRKGYLNEVTAAEKLESFRREQEHYVSASFETISASGPNSAIIHYRPSLSAARMLSADEMYLCDSGAQYLDGTTDVTRTLHFGTPSQHEKECFTRILKGNIQLASATFPAGTRGHILDILARKPLWDIGLNYLHGTGHGVGAFLNVHEGPQGISPKVTEDEPLKPGMFVTDEPGYYEDGSFGIRIENVLLVKDVSLKHNFNSTGYYGFDHVTLVPIQTKLLVPEILTDSEIEWINEYHALCEDKIGKILKEQNKSEALHWLMKECQPLG